LRRNGLTTSNHQGIAFVSGERRPQDVNPIRKELSNHRRTILTSRVIIQIGSFLAVHLYGIILGYLCKMVFCFIFIIF
jgi:hypothetical protein